MAVAMRKEEKMEDEMERWSGGSGTSNDDEELLVGGYGTSMVANMEEACVCCTTFNILAPIYKRLEEEDQSLRESHYRAYWFGRNQRILDRLLSEMSSIICLQEVWVGNQELVDMYEKRLGDAGYLTYKLARTNNRGDGLLAALHKDYFQLLNYEELLFNDVADRVAQILHVESVFPLWKNQSSTVNQQVLIVNTHLLFPHDCSFSIIRLHQVHMILQYIETYQTKHNLAPMPIILCGDWNGSKRGHVYKFLRSQGFVSSYDAAHHYTDSDADAHKWVSHRNHRGNVCGVDFIWLLNPNKIRKPLMTSWSEAVFGIMKVSFSLLLPKRKISHVQLNLVHDPSMFFSYTFVYKEYSFDSHISIVCHFNQCLFIQFNLRQISPTEVDAFAFFKEDNTDNFITFQGFCQALFQLNLTCHPHGFNPEEVQCLWMHADPDGNGTLNHKEFQRIWNPSCIEQSGENHGDCNWEELKSGQDHATMGFQVKTAALFPPEAGQGSWPENYSLSDHVPLTVVFSPRTLTSLQPIC